MADRVVNLLADRIGYDDPAIDRRNIGNIDRSTSPRKSITDNEVPPVTDTVFMIHGMWGNAGYWQNYKNVLERAGYRCVASTLRFHDMDPKAAPDPRLGKMSLLDYAEDLEREVRGLGVQPILLGHSMGGLLAQMLAARGLGKAAVLLTPASPYGIIPIRVSVVRSFLSAMLRWGFWRRPMRQTFGEASYSMLQLLPPAEQRSAYEKFVYESERAHDICDRCPVQHSH